MCPCLGNRKNKRSGLSSGSAGTQPNLPRRFSSGQRHAGAGRRALPGHRLDDRHVRGSGRGCGADRGHIEELPEQAAAELHQTFETARSLLLDGYIEHYLRLSGMAWEQLEAWILPAAAARLDENLPEGEARHVLRFVRERLASH